MSGSYFLAGDILAFQPIKGDFVGETINNATLNRGYSHLAIVYSVDCDTVVIVESVNESKFSGVRARKLNESELFHVYRCHNMKYSFIDVANWCYKQIGSGYDIQSFISSWLKSTVCRVFGFGWFRTLPPVINDPKRYNCAELIATGFNRIYGLNLVYGLHYSATVPNDIVDCIFVSRVTILPLYKPS